MAIEERRATVVTWADRADGWVRDARLLDAVFAPFTAALLDAADLSTATRVLDVGCGTGSLLEAVLAHDPERCVSVVGVDVALGMVIAARQRVPRAVVVRADAQVADLVRACAGRLFDRVVSRFGVMFFADPVAAFANIRAATTWGARLSFVSWREDEDDMFLHGIRALSARLDPPVAAPVPGRPGPLGLADAPHIREVLTGAGWADVSIRSLDGLCDFCLDGGDGVEDRLAMVLDGGVGQVVQARLERQLGPGGWEAVLDDARAELRASMVDGGVRFTGRAWLVTAVNP